MKKLFFILFFLQGIILVKAQPCYCEQIWKSIERYQTGQSANVLSTRYECLSDSLKMNLISVLKNEFTDEEMEVLIARRMGTDWLAPIERETWRIIKKDTVQFGIVKDSLVEARREMWRTESLNRSVDKSVILLVGQLDIKESIPVLHDALKDTVRYDKYTVEIVLARLGDSIFYKKYFNEWSSPFDYKNKNIIGETKIKKRLMFLATQESMYALSQYLAVDKRIYTIDGSIRVYYHVGFDIWRSLLSCIENEDFQNYYKNKYTKIIDGKKYNFMPLWLSSPDELDKKDIEYALKWMEANKGKYVINRDI